MSDTKEEPWGLAAGWQQAVGGYRGVLRRKPRSGGKPVTVRWSCEHTHPNTDVAQTCACIEKDNRWRARSAELGHPEVAVRYELSESADRQ